MEEDLKKRVVLLSFLGKAGRRGFFLTSYFIFLPAFILSIALFQVILLSQKSNVNRSGTTRSIEYKAVPDRKQDSVVSIVPREARVDILLDFLSKYKSPLAPYAKMIVDTADKYGLDYRLIPAIAMQESTLCKKMPKDSYNCWGFGIYGKKVTRFPNFDSAIETVTKTLAKNYKSMGLVEPQEIMSIYTPSNNGIWADNVSYIMTKLELP